MKKKETRVLCPECGTEFQVADKEAAAIAVKIGKGSGAEIIYPAVAEPEAQVKTPKLPVKAQERIEALQNAGVDVSHLFAMQGSGGGEYVVSNKGGKLSILEDDDPLFRAIVSQGTVPNRRLFRRWVMAQMFHMLSYKDYLCKEPVGVTEMIHRLGYEYQWKMLMRELHAQMKMEGRDPGNFADRNRWFNREVVEQMAQDYIGLLNRHVDGQPVKKCKGVPYKRIGGENIFMHDLHRRLFSPLGAAAARIRYAKDAARLYDAAQKFNDLRVRMKQNAPQSKAWVDAYKGAGAYFTTQNLIRFHGCTLIDDYGKRQDKYQSLAYLSAKAEAYKNGEGWRMLAMLKKMLDDNGIDVAKKMKEWHSKK